MHVLVSLAEMFDVACLSLQLCSQILVATQQNGTYSWSLVGLPATILGSAGTVQG